MNIQRERERERERAAHAGWEAIICDVVACLLDIGPWPSRGGGEVGDGEPLGVATKWATRIEPLRAATAPAMESLSGLRRWAWERGPGAAA
jgi:hypothetical protein